MKLADPYIHYAHSFLKNRFYKISYENKLSMCYPMKARVPQRSTLAPTLYSINFSDVPKHPNTKIAQYTEDTVIYITHENINTIIRRTQ